MDDKKSIQPYDYLKGSDFVDALKNKLNCRTHQELADLLGIPKSTFSTWAKHERTSHEVMVRLHLNKGIPIEELALTTEELNKIANGKVEVANSHVAMEERAVREQNPQHGVTLLKSFCLSGGKLLDTGEIPYPVRRINSLGLQQANLIEVETNDAIYLLDKSMMDALRGNYLIDIDGHLSINRIQRLPGKKLAIAFDDSTIEVSDEDIQVIGYIAATLKKD
ncbi:helix-turn-helix domain-containing protein [Vibrio clamense]|uniref:phage repressor protein CI n=1 Tax=Vibrio clamense TaxID=2910254 RepID=UPI003D1F7B36